MTDEEFQRFGAGIDQCLQELRQVSGPVILKAAALTEDPEGRAAAVSMLIKAVTPIFYHAFEDGPSRSALIQTLESMASDMRQADRPSVN